MGGALRRRTLAPCAALALAPCSLPTIPPVTRTSSAPRNPFFKGKRSSAPISDHLPPNPHVRRSNDSDVKHSHREIMNHQSLLHPHVVQLKEVMCVPPYLAIVMEYVPGGDMFQYVVSRRGLPEAEARWFFQQLILGMDYCHRKGMHASSCFREKGGKPARCLEGRCAVTVSAPKLVPAWMPCLQPRVQPPPPLSSPKNRTPTRDKTRPQG